MASMKTKISIIVLQLLVITNFCLAETSSCNLVNTALPIAVKIRGLKPKAKVPCKQKNRKEVEEYLTESLNEPFAKTRMQNDEVVFKILGFVPEDFDYFNQMIKLYGEQIGGFYDPKKKFYAMASWMPESIQLPIAVHELTHALQDQHFNLSKLMDDKIHSTDTLLARSALAEGDATAVMIDYSLNSSGQAPISKQENVNGFLMQNILGAMFTAGLNNSPKSIQSLILFPYTSGLNFVHKKLFNKSYSAIDSVFKNPPSSTAEILHPTKFKKISQELLEPDISKYKNLKSNTALTNDTLGEFLVSTLLANWIYPNLAADAANGWQDDKLSLYQKIEGNKYLLLWEILWRDNQEAKEFFSSINSAYESRFKSKFNCETTTSCSYKNNNYNILITQKENIIKISFEQ